MPIHDWRRVPAGIYHHVHNSWIAELSQRLNNGLLPGGFHALAEQVAGETGPDGLSLDVDSRSRDSSEVPAGGTALAVTPPRVSYRLSLNEEEIYARRRRTLAIRQVHGDYVAACIEILSPGSKSTRVALKWIRAKTVAALSRRRHVLLVDPFPPGSLDPEGMHDAIWSQFSDSVWQQPAEKPLTLAAYTGGLLPRAYVEPIAIGAVLPDMPLFLDEDWYINVPLEATYMEAYTTVPRRWRQVIEGDSDNRGNGE